MDIVNPNYLNYMEQIQKNRKDIEKLYDQELSDITQLNFKENDENGLDYENGKATFYGKSTIIRDENTENLEIDSKVELKISSGDDDIVIDAGEDNSTLEIHLDNETRNKINRALLIPINAPTERSFVMVDTNNGEVIEEEDTILSKFKNICKIKDFTLDTKFTLNGVSADASAIVSEVVENFEVGGKYLIIWYGYCSTDDKTCGLQIAIDNASIYSPGSNARTQELYMGTVITNISAGNHSIKLLLSGRGNMEIPAYHKLGYVIVKLGGIL